MAPSVTAKAFSDTLPPPDFMSGQLVDPAVDDSDNDSEGCEEMPPLEDSASDADRRDIEPYESDGIDNDPFKDLPRWKLKSSKGWSKLAEHHRLRSRKRVA